MSLNNGKNLAHSDKQISKPDERFTELNLPPNREVEKYIRWVEEHKSIDIDSFTWYYRVGVTYITFEHYKEAIGALEKAEQHSSTNWDLFFKLAKAHENQKNHRLALGYIQKFKSLSEMFLETDDSYKEAYWDMLKTEGDCYQQCSDHNLAVKSFQDLLSQDIDDASGMSWLHLHALSGLFKTWTDTKNFQSIIAFIRSWKDVTAQGRGSTYWLRSASREVALHECIIVAAKHVEAVEEVISLYQEAIDYTLLDQHTVDDREMDISTEATKQLRYFQAVLIFHGSKSRKYQLRSIQCWEDIVLQSDEDPASYETACNAIRKLAPSLLDVTVAELGEAPSSCSEDFAIRLENLVNQNTTTICELRQGYYDPRLCLARLYCVKQNHTSASTQAQIRLCSVFDKWPEASDDASLTIRFSNLAQTLNVLDKDADAIAAWQAIRPYQPSSAANVKADAPGTEELLQPISEPSNTEGVPATSDKDVGEGPAASSSITTANKAYLTGYSCDGGCGTEWVDMLADCWVCKHCLCVQLCRGCYKKLLDDDLHPLVCNKDHKMLFLPPFDWEAWHTTPAEMMVVDKQLVPRKAWVDRIRKEFKVQQEEIDFIKMEKARELWAASVMTLRWRNRLHRIRASRPSKASKV